MSGGGQADEALLLTPIMARLEVYRRDPLSVVPRDPGGAHLHPGGGRHRGPGLRRLGLGEPRRRDARWDNVEPNWRYTCN